MGMFKLRSLTHSPAWVLIFRSDNFYSMFVPSLPSSNQSPLTRPTYRAVDCLHPLSHSTVYCLLSTVYCLRSTVSTQLSHRDTESHSPGLHGVNMAV